MKIYSKYILICLGLVGIFCNQPSALYGQEVTRAHIDSVIAVMKSQNVKEQAKSYEALGFQIMRNHTPEDATPLFEYTLEKDTTDLAKLWIYDPYSKNMSRLGLLDEACTEVRPISHNMMPQALSISGLKGAVEDLGDQLTEQGFETTIEISKLPEGMDSTREVMIYRLLQELLSNIRKHAQASTILIQFIGHGQDLSILVEDNGLGFNYEEQLAKGGLGLESINSRVQFLDGSINWDSQPGNGTVINITIPVK